MKLLTLLGAALVAAAPAPALAQRTPTYATAMATQICLNMREGMTANDAATKAIKVLFPVFGRDLARDGFEYSARLIVAERIILCPDLK